jgi:hypothetical protein
MWCLLCDQNPCICIDDDDIECTPRREAARRRATMLAAAAPAELARTAVVFTPSDSVPVQRNAQRFEHIPYYVFSPLAFYAYGWDDSTTLTLTVHHEVMFTDLPARLFGSCRNLEELQNAWSTGVVKPGWVDIKVVNPSTPIHVYVTGPIHSLVLLGHRLK